MEAEDDEDLRLTRTAKVLLAELEECLPKVLWKGGINTTKSRKVHQRIKTRCLEHIIQQVRPLQRSG